MSVPGKGNSSDPFTIIHGLLCKELIIYACQFVRDLDIADGIVAEVFAELHRKDKDFENIDNIKPLLYVAVKNRCIDYYRRKGKGKKYENFNDYSSLEKAHRAIQIDREIRGLQPDEERAELFRKIYEALEEMPPKARQIIEDLFLNGRSARQVAEERGININTVYDNKKNALKLLRKIVHNMNLLMIFIFL